jgi:hypothetical protein
MKPIPPWLQNELNQVPKAGDGVHRWLFCIARHLHWHLAPEEIFRLLKIKVSGCGRVVTNEEITNAINDSARVQWRPNDTQANDHFSAVSHSKWSPPRFLAIQQIVHEGIGLVDLVERSPCRFDTEGAHTEEIIDTLFPGNPLLCVGKNRSVFATRSRETWRGRLTEMALMVPNPMLTVQGHTKNGKTSEHTLEGTGRQVYQVIEYDFSLTNRNGTAESIWAPLVKDWTQNGITVSDACAALLLKLATRWPLVLAVYSGSKSIHGWFRVFELSLTQRFAFMHRAVSLGADPATWCRSQFVRVPDGLRDNGKRQTTYYLNRSEAIKDESPAH